MIIRYQPFYQSSVSWICPALSGFSLGGDGTDLLPSQHSEQGYTIHGAIRQELQDGNEVLDV